jgi:HK97 family phage major capsid protein
MNKAIRELLAKKAKHVERMKALNDLAKKESRDLNETEEQEFAAEQKAVTGINAAIAREQSIAEHDTDAGRNAREDRDISDRRQAASDNPQQGGFNSMGEFALAVRRAMTNSGTDERLVIGAAAPGTFGNEAAGQDGGFLVPPAFANEIFTLSLDDDAILPLTDQVIVSGNGMTFPKDETTPWGTDGVRAYWQAEATAAQQTKPVVGTQAMRLHKLMSLVPVSDELLADTTALASYIVPLMARSIGWKTSESLIWGTGAGQPYGAFTNTNIAVVVAKDVAQAANTLTIGNITNMIARLPPGSFPRSRWLITPDALPALFQMQLGNYPIYMAPGGAKDSPYGSLLGRPIQVSQHASAFSAQGDVMLADFSYMRTIQKSGGVDVQSSMHLFFDAGVTAFRALFRIDGQPKISKQITQARSSNKLSPFVMLQNR